MDKTYCDFMDEISEEELYEGLLAYGLFAEKIPPVFTSVPFFDYCEPLFMDKTLRIDICIDCPCFVCKIPARDLCFFKKHTPKQAIF